MNLVFSCRTWCKVCNELVLECDPENDDIHCTDCGTRYAWRVHEPSGYRFLTPEACTRILRRCDDRLGMG